MTRSKLTSTSLCLAAFAAVAAVAVAAFAGTLGHGFVFDDYPLIVKNPVLRDARNLVPLFGLDGRLPAPRSLRTALDLFDYSRGGGTPRAFHETTIALHGIASLLVFAFARRVAPRGPAALAAALAFAAHPVHADAVAFVSGRKDVLVTALSLASILAFLRHRETGRAVSGVACVVCFLLALLAKEMAAAVPLVLLALDAALVDPRVGISPGIGRALRTRALLHGATFSLAIGAAVVAVFAHEISSLVGPDGYRPIGGSALAHALTAARVAATACSVLLLPVRLRGDYSFAVIEPSAGFGPREAGAILVLALVASTLVLLRRRAPLVAALGLAAILSYLPVSHVLPHHEMFSEHSLYLPSVFACAAFGVGAAAIAARLRARAGPVGIAIGVGVALLFARTVDRAADFRDVETWCRAILREAPDCARARYNLGEVHRIAGRRGEAESEYLRAIEIGSRNPSADRNLASAWNQAGLLRWLAFQEAKRRGVTRDALADLDLAAERFAKATRFAPREPGPRTNLAMACLEQGDLARAARVVAEGEAASVTSYHLAYVGAFCRARGGAGADESLASAREAFARATTAEQRAESARLLVRALAAAGEPECVIVALRALRRDRVDGAPAGARERMEFLRDTRRAARERLDFGAPLGAPESGSMARLRSLASEAILARRDRRGEDAARAESAFSAALLLQAESGEIRP